MGYTVRDDSFRLTEWKRWDGDNLSPVWDDTVAMELYDHRTDLGQDLSGFGNINVANRTEFST
eukprot:CAMPEP_0206302094 /NCGR_PEP_ID=MMETSP0106_2-20121207/8546_1 /ASSEMBLY_ACC=CAM_ASM_000206 /TAXON_ID=81532 /ORGANISM="Acanthoeca-like sp., Strain 10tr" /LENGTH=62 /DNA_ID=CAMNT_0053732851 /DNA_START=174 /DNA_END=358 /DNA_ORIENTATION=+